MTGQVVSHYRVLEQIGGGGMGVVYRAQDLRLGRQVALKFLPPEMSARPGALERFRREAETVSALNHPHICTLYDVGEHDGRQFLVLEFVEGRTLKQTINDAPLPMARAIAFSMQLADALAAAHAKGIVHRDVKPTNILITSRGDAKLLDFGIAKLHTPAQAADDVETRARLTARGDWIGTPDYMAPEQIRGDEADPRTDVFALGAVMYEMTTGRPPFAADSPGRSLEAVLTSAPTRPAQLNAIVPSALEEIILKALEKDRLLRYQSADDMLADLRRLERDRRDATAATAIDDSRAGKRRPRATVPILAGTAVLVAVLAAAWWWTGAGRSRPALSPAGARADGPQRLVVLPFENLTRNPADDWLAGAFADSINAGLQSVDTLILVPRERVIQLYASMGRREPDPLAGDLAAQISAKLRVRFYVHGSYQRVDEELRVVSRLVDVQGDALGAQETVTDRFTRVLALQDVLATRFAARLNPAATVRARSGPPRNLEAFQLLTQARGLYALSEWAQAMAIVEQALARDASFGEAWALLSKVHSRMSSPAVVLGQPDREALQLAMNESRTAVRLAPDELDSHIALALAYRGLGDRPGWRQAAKQAIAVDPRSGEAHTVLADSLSMSPGFGCPVDPQPDTAESEYREGQRLDPLLGSNYVNLTTHLWWMNQPVPALANIDAGLALQPDNVSLRTTRPFNLVFAGREDEAEVLLRERRNTRMRESATDILTPGYISLKRRQFDLAAELFRSPNAESALKSLAWRLITAAAHFAAGRPVEGGRHLTRGLEIEPRCRQWATIVPALAPYRALPEFKAALATGR